MAAISSNTWKMICPIAAILLGLTMTGVQSAAAPGIITNFTINGNQSGYQLVSIGMPIQVICRAYFNSSSMSIVHINKVDPNNFTWVISEDDEQAQNFNFVASPAWTLVATPPSNLPPNTKEIVLTIPSAQNGDTGNYTCAAGSVGSATAKSIKVNVITEATLAVLSLNGVPYTSNYNVAQVNIGQAYQLSCTVSGGNPHPTVNLTTYRGTLANAVNTYGTNATYTGVTGLVNRFTTVTVNSWTIDSTLIGRPVTCTGGVRTPNAVVASFMPMSNTAAPQFTCGDAVAFPGPTSQTTLTISCSVFAPNLTSAYVTWYSVAGVNNTIVGALGQTVTYSADQRYTLQLTAQSNGFYTVTLNVNNAKQVSDLYKNQYKFIAINLNGQALHSVTVYGGTYTGGALSNALSTFSFVLTLLIAATAAGTLML